MYFERHHSLCSSVFHPNLSLFMGCSTQEGRLLIVTELMVTNLENLLRDKCVLLEVDSLTISYELVSFPSHADGKGRSVRS